MKKYLILIAAAMVAAGVAQGDTEVVNGVTWSYSIVNGEATVIQGTTPCAGEMVMPDTLGGSPVTAIGSKAFNSKGEITKMMLPATVRSIGDYAFYSCTALGTINFPEGVTTIGYRTFSNCSVLTAVLLPDSVTSLGKEAFYHCTTLKTLKLSSKLTMIPFEAFNNCSKLTKIVIPSSVTSIGEHSFSSCSALTSLTLSDGLMKIDTMAFYGCVSLTALKIPSTVTSVAENAFRLTRSLKTIEVADGCTCVKVVDGCLVSSSGTALLAAPSGNEHVTIPEGVASIQANMFSGATTLKTVTLPSTLLTMDYCAFAGCSALIAIEFPAGFASFSSCDHFSGCSALKEVVFNGAPPANIANTRVLNYGPLAYPREYGAAWQKVVELAKFNGYKRTNEPEVEYVSVAVRANDPTILDVVYKVKSAKPTVKVRALAFKDGVRSFANVVRPVTFIEDTVVNIGDAITANVEHKLTWRVSADWKVDLAKCKFEVLAVENDLLPMELRTIPANGDNKAMEISWNALTESQVFDALLWLYAAGDAGLTLENGVLRRASDNYILAYGTTLSTLQGRSKKDVYGVGTSSYQYFARGVEYVFSKMGYSVLSGDALTYANKMTRLGLSPDGVRQYAYKWLEQ